MTVQLIHVGEFKENHYAAAAAEYVRRLGAFCDFIDTPVKETKISDERSAAEVSKALESEGVRILAAVKQRSYPVALCIEGRQMDSGSFAALLEKRRADPGSVSFIIGSSHGLSESVKRSCGLLLSMSVMTFPHSLARVMLLEQIYRAFSIASGGKYHK